MDLAKSFSQITLNPEARDTGQFWLTEPQLKRLAHIPLLTLFYLYFQKRVSSTPVTALELAAYLGVDVRLSEAVLLHLEQRGTVKLFKEGIPAYSLKKELEQVSLKDLLEIVGVIQQWVKKGGQEVAGPSAEESQEKYRKIYSELASEMLQLFGEEAVNKMPL